MTAPTTSTVPGWPDTDALRGQVHDLHARAGVLASESSLLGLACALALAHGVALLVIPTAVLPVSRALLASAAGLAAIGLALAALARLMRVGGADRGLPWQRQWWPMWLTGLGCALTQATALLLQNRHEALLGSEPVAVLTLWSSGLLLAATLGVLVALLGLAAVGLRQLSVWWPAGGQPAPLVPLTLPALHLYATLAHLLAGGVGLLALIGLGGPSQDPQLRTFLAMAVSTLCVHATLPSVVLLGQFRRALRPLRAAGVRLSTLERGYALSAAGVVLGLLLPGLVALANLLDVVQQGLGPACALLAASSHALRYGLVLLSWTKPQPQPPITA